MEHCLSAMNMAYGPYNGLWAMEHCLREGIEHLPVDHEHCLWAMNMAYGPYNGLWAMEHCLWAMNMAYGPWNIAYGPCNGLVVLADYSTDQGMYKGVNVAQAWSIAWLVAESMASGQ